MGILVHTLHHLGNLSVFLLVASALVTLVIALPWLRARLGIAVPDAVSDGAADAFKSIVSFMVLVLAFSLIQVQGHLRSGEELVQREANLLNVMDRTLLRFGQPATDAARAILHEYTRVTITDEWPLMQNEQRSDKVEILYTDLSRSIRNIEPTTPRQQAQHGELIRHLDELSDLREARVTAVELGLPDLYWWTIIALMAIALVLASFTHSRLDKQIAQAGLICAAGLLLALVIIYDGQFQGETSVAATPLERTMKAMQARRL